MTTTTTPAGIQVIPIRGALVVGNRQTLKERVLDLLSTGTRLFVIDFAETGYVDASGWGALVSIWKHVYAAGGQIILAGLNEDLREIFLVTRLNELFTLADTAAIAVAALEHAAA